MPHDVDNYTIGKGILSIAEWTSTTPPTEFVDLGNAPMMEVQPSVERLPHYSSRSGLKTKDKNPIVQSEYSINFELDEPAAYQMNIYLMGTLAGGQISGMQGANKEYSLKFVSDNPLGRNNTWLFHKVTLAPNGALQLIGEEWMNMSFAGEGLADTANNPSSPFFTVTYTTTTTTTTTTT
jgi:hypothetical protein